MTTMMAVVQSKNFPAISFLQKHGFKFSGYNERYYRNQDIALYFWTWVIGNGRPLGLDLARDPGIC